MISHYFVCQLKITNKKNWRGGLAVKLLLLERTGVQLGTQYLPLVTHTQALVTPASGDLLPSSGLARYLHTCGVHIYIHTQVNTHTH